MTDKDFEKMIEAKLKEATPWGRINLAGIMQALIIAGIIGLFTKLQRLENTDVSRNEKIANIQSDVTELKNFTRQPRFTKEDFQVESKPIIQTLDNINDNQKEIKSDIRAIKQSENAFERRLIKLENIKIID